MTVGDRIRKLRQQKKITQTELAEKVNTTKQNIYKYETGIISNIPYDKLELIAEALGTSPQHLLGWDDMEAQIDKYNSTDPDLIEKYNGDLDAAYAEQQRIDQANTGSFLECLSNKDKELLNDYLKLNELGKDKAIDYVKDLASVEKYTK